MDRQEAEKLFEESKKKFPFMYEKEIKEDSDKDFEYLAIILWADSPEESLKFFLEKLKMGFLIYKFIPVANETCIFLRREKEKMKESITSE